MQISIMDGGAAKFKTITIPDIKTLLSVITKNTYSLGRFNEDHRTNNNFNGSLFIGLDFDNGMSLSDAVSIFKDFTHVIGTTRNHNKSKDGVVAERFRVILKLKYDITNKEDYKATVASLLAKYPSADRACSDAARMFYPCEEIISVNENGLLIEPIKPLVVDSKKTTVNNINKGKLSKITLEFIENGPESSSIKGTVSNTRLFKAAVDCLEQGYSKEEAIEVLKPSVKNYGGDFNDNDIKTINSAYNRDPKYPPRLKDSPFNFRKATEVSENAKELTWLVDGFLIEGGLSILAGAPKSGKSTLTRQLAMCVAKGVSFLDRKVKKGKTIYLALEEQENMLAQQFKHIGVTDSDDIVVHVGPTGAGNLNDALRESIEQYGANLVVIDTLLLFANFENPNDYNEAYKKLSEYRNIARTTGAHIITLHHQNKGEDRGANSVLGSTAIQGAVDNTIVLNGIRNRESYRKISSFQRGGERFINKELKYNTPMDIYEISNNDHVDF